MKIAIASDLHGSLSFAREFFERAESLGAEKVVLLGDLYYHGARNPLPEGYDPKALSAFLNENKDRLIAVKGNCDSAVDQTVSDFTLAESAVLFLGGKTVFCTHGDKFNKDELPKGKFDLVLYGHFHTGFIERIGDVIFANPGSTSLPKGGTPRSFLLLTEEKISLYDLSGELLRALSL